MDIECSRKIQMKFMNEFKVIYDGMRCMYVNEPVCRYSVRELINQGNVTKDNQSSAFDAKKRTCMGIVAMYDIQQLENNIMTDMPMEFTHDWCFKRQLPV